MEIVFLNSMEKREGGAVQAAQVLINVEESCWQVVWIDRADGRRDEWYTGEDWSEMLTAFREQLAVRREEGYRPVVAWPEGGFSGKGTFTQVLDYYAKDHHEAAVYEQLRAWRRQRAGEEGKAPYQILGNRVLRCLPAYLPHSSEELAQLPGIGERKLELYAEPILAVTGGIQRRRAFPLNWVADEIDPAAFEVWFENDRAARQAEWEKRQKLNGTLPRLLELNLPLSELSDRLGISAEDIVRHVERREELEQLNDWLLAEMERIPGEERKLAMDAFEAEGDKLLKPVAIRLYGEDLGNRDAGEVYTLLRLLRMGYRRQARPAADNESRAS